MKVSKPNSSQSTKSTHATQSGASKSKPSKLVSPLDQPLPKKNPSFNAPDREGMPDGKGVKRHGALDWFAKAGSKVRAPQDGKIIEVKKSKGNSGQIFGGTVKVQGKDGKVWTFRHVDPANLKVGDKVKAGDTVGRVTDWKSGSDHVHIELWKSAKGGYNFNNAIDPLKALQGSSREVTRDAPKTQSASGTQARSTDVSADLFETHEAIATAQPLSLDGYGSSPVTIEALWPSY
ncbi:M23 family metallopeptidase [Myxococcus sp. K15C18031901]|uniref:M23 family metallopeptidase n=1 Tax=Myxococcus dinghuensis TaxID=2906761 RepID=UPI0020A81807|nr:M23 family metallopeptidase [Myxococcus dinghuensis]MCP3100726.1 M23 family metallopeptidase [Myxococcus dinghuensis]